MKEYMDNNIVFLGFDELFDDNLSISHIILIFKFDVYDAKSNGYLNIEYLRASTDKTKNIEKKISKRDPNKRSKHLKKYRPFIEYNT